MELVVQFSRPPILQTQSNTRILQELLRFDEAGYNLVSGFISTRLSFPVDSHYGNAGQTRFLQSAYSLLWW
jgi:hypothetical protein